MRRLETLCPPDDFYLWGLICNVLPRMWSVELQILFMYVCVFIWSLERVGAALAGTWCSSVPNDLVGTRVQVLSGSDVDPFGERLERKIMNALFCPLYCKTQCSFVILIRESYLAKKSFQIKKINWQCHNFMNIDWKRTNCHVNDQVNVRWVGMTCASSYHVTFYLPSAPTGRKRGIEKRTSKAGSAKTQN